MDVSGTLIATLTKNMATDRHTPMLLIPQAGVLDPKLSSLHVYKSCNTYHTTLVCVQVKDADAHNEIL